MHSPIQPWLKTITFISLDLQGVVADRQPSGFRQMPSSRRQVRKNTKEFEDEEHQTSSRRVGTISGKRGSRRIPDLFLVFLVFLVF